ncbi:MAG: hypothetical protein ACKV2T_39710 [Kofleriaceae bacterium]
MQFGKAPLKLVPSFSRRRIRLGVAHHGAPSSWAPQSKETQIERGKPQKKRR